MTPFDVALYIAAGSVIIFVAAVAVMLLYLGLSWIVRKL